MTVFSHLDSALAEIVHAELDVAELKTEIPLEIVDKFEMVKRAVHRLQHRMEFQDRRLGLSAEAVLQKYG